MAIGYIRVKRTIHTGYNPGEKYLAQIFRSNNVSMKQICKEISDGTDVSYSNAIAALQAFEQIFSRHILNGAAIKLDFLGHFIPSIKATAMDTLDKVTPYTIQKAKCRFYPSKDFMNQLKANGFILRDLNVKGYQSGATPEEPVIP